MAKAAVLPPSHLIYLHYPIGAPRKTVRHDGMHAKVSGVSRDSFACGFVLKSRPAQVQPTCDNLYYLSRRFSLIFESVRGLYHLTE